MGCGCGPCAGAIGAIGDAAPATPPPPVEETDSGSSTAGLKWLCGGIVAAAAVLVALHFRR